MSQGITTDSNRSRILYLDYLKGFTILCIIMHHTYTCNSIFDGNHQNAVFFFISGIFFSHKPFNVRLRTIFKRIIIPFTCFYILGFFYQIISHYWDYRNLSSFDWSMIGDIFDISERQGYLRPNVPLWFLFSLAIIQFSYHFITTKIRLKWIKILLALLIIGCFEIIMATPTPLMLNKVAYWIAFFTLGDVIGKYLIKCNAPTIKLIITSLVLWILLLIFEYNIGNYFYFTIKQYEILVFCILSIILFRNIGGVI